MTQTARRREMVEGLREGYYKRTGPDGSTTMYTTTNQWRSKGSVDDIVSKPPEPGKYFLVQKNTVDGGRYTNKYGNDTYVNFIPTRYRNINQPIFQVHLGIPGKPTDAFLLTELIKRTNPDTSEISLPLFVYELREIPKAIFDIGRFFLNGERNFLPQSLAEHYISQNFGWAPLISDLDKLLSLSNSIDKRFSSFMEIRKKGGKAFTRELHKGEILGPLSSRITMESLASVMYSYEQRYTKSRTWGYARWGPKPLLPLSPPELRRVAAGSVYGYNLRPSQLWDFIPWTWLIDYFTNVGDFIEANAGSVAFELKDYAIMEHITTTLYIKYTSLPASKIDKGAQSTITYESKSRRAPAFSLTTKYDKPALTGYQSSILGSLFTIKLLGKTK